MVGKSRICEICGVRERHRPGFFANFPIDEQRCRTWVQIVGKEDLVHIPIEKLHEIKFICRDHFIARDFNKKGNRLKKRGYPKLNLSAPPLTDHQLKNFPLHVASKSGLAPTLMERVVLAAPVASGSKTLVTATIQNIIEIATHRFPNPDKFPEQFKAWVGIVGGKLEKSSDYNYYRKKIVCDKHFSTATATG